MTDPVRPLEVVAAVIQRSDGRFLLAQRPVGRVYAGYWEFPGGKVEPGESLHQALERELREELGIRVGLAYPWVSRCFHYPHALVRLNFFRVTGWQGKPHGHEEQALAWQRAEALTVHPMLPANAPILRALQLPPVYGITAASIDGEEKFLDRLERALSLGLRLIQVREKAMTPQSLTRFATSVVDLAHRYDAKVIVNGSPEIARAAGADGVHLSAESLIRATARPDAEWCGASCHDRRELDRAAMLGLDFAVLGPVRQTASHPGGRTLGWLDFQVLIHQYSLPVYAIGGMTRSDLVRAWEHAGHGIAAIRGAWAV